MALADRRRCAAALERRPAPIQASAQASRIGTAITLINIFAMLLHGASI